MTRAAGASLAQPSGRPGSFRRFLANGDGFGLVELLIALLVLNVAIFATVAAFNAGMFTLRRASRTSTAASLAEAQLELYRALSYGSIVLTDAVLDPQYTGDPQAVGDLPPVPGCPSGVPPEACEPIQPGVQGADGNKYRVDTYVRERVETTSPFPGRAVKIVAVVVRDVRTLDPIARMESTFDQGTGA